MASSIKQKFEMCVKCAVFPDPITYMSNKYMWHPSEGKCHVLRRRHRTCRKLLKAKNVFPERQISSVGRLFVCLFVCFC